MALQVEGCGEEDGGEKGGEAGLTLLPSWQRSRKVQEQLQRRSPDPSSPFSGRSSDHSNSSGHWQGILLHTLHVPDVPESCVRRINRRSLAGPVV